jgi:hypothetical protein
MCLARFIYLARVINNNNHSLNSTLTLALVFPATSPLHHNTPTESVFNFHFGTQTHRTLKHSTSHHITSHHITSHHITSNTSLSNTSLNTSPIHPSNTPHPQTHRIPKHIAPSNLKHIAPSNLKHIAPSNLKHIAPSNKITSLLPSHHNHTRTRSTKNKYLELSSRFSTSLPRKKATSSALVMRREWAKRRSPSKSACMMN